MPNKNFNAQQAADAITRGGFTWGSGIVTFGFRTSSPSYSISGHSDTQQTFSRFTDAEKYAARAALKLWSDIANIKFSDQNDTNNAAIELGNYYSMTDGAGGFAYTPTGNRSAQAQDGDVFINSRYVSTYNLAPGSYGFHVMMHEIGHAIGLQHPGNYNSSPTYYPNYTRDADYIQDNFQYTVMSYFDEENTGGLFKGYPETPMMDDIAALQKIYGANMSTRTENTTYGFNSNAGAPYLINANHFDATYCVWDAGGSDTFDFSGYSQNANIQLAARSFSSVGGSKNNISIADKVLIENAIGGAGDDTIGGNDASNALKGSNGNDVISGYSNNDSIYGGAGDDRVYGGLGADRLDGGDGFDTADYGEIKTGVLIDLIYSYSNSGEAAGDIFVSIEAIAGSYVGKDTLLGDNNRNVFFGRGGDDFLNGRGGNDDLYGNEGSDRLDGEGGNDFLVGASGADQLNGGGDFDTAAYDGASTAITIDLLNLAANTGDAAGDTYSSIEAIAGTYNFNDVLLGDAADNTFFGRGGDDGLYGRDGNDVLIGESGNDFLVGGAGADQLTGGGDFDIASYDGATAGIIIDLSNLSANAGDAAGDTFSGIEEIAGTYDYNDGIYGDAADNVFYGRGGNDGLYGRAGHDVLNGGDGSDILNGEAGNDVLVGGSGGDQLIGGSDFDIAAYDGAISGVTVDLLKSSANTGDAAGDTFSGIEAIAGTYDYSDILRGNNNANTFFGRGGNDVIEGRGGADVLYGEAGADIFLFRALTDSTVASGGRDTIQDFSRIQGDRIDLHYIDANTSAGSVGNQAFMFIAAKAFTGHAGELRAVMDGSNAIISGDVNGDGKADFAVTVKSMASLQQSDFVL